MHIVADSLALLRHSRLFQLGRPGRSLLVLSLAASAAAIAPLESNAAEGVLRQPWEALQPASKGSQVTRIGLLIANDLSVRGSEFQPQAQYSDVAQVSPSSQPASSPLVAPILQPRADPEAEAYRDAIVSIVDPMAHARAYGQYGPGKGSQLVDRVEVPCVLTFTRTEEAEKDISRRVGDWAVMQVPASLAASHAEVMSWVAQAKGAASVVPPCVLPFMQASRPQLAFLLHLGHYVEVRKRAASVLATMGVTLPPLPRP